MNRLPRFGYVRILTAMHTFAAVSKVLNRSPVYLAGLQKRFELPPLGGAAYSNAYVAFLRAVINLRKFDIAEEMLRDLWRIEKKLLQLLHVDSAGSRTWFLDSCGVQEPGSEACACVDEKLSAADHAHLPSAAKLLRRASRRFRAVSRI